jgi:uncharacterized iron-regulated membrane protein
MRKTLVASVLVVLLACSAHAGILMWDRTPPPAPPPPAEETQSEASVTEGESSILTQLAILFGISWGV